MEQYKGYVVRGNGRDTDCYKRGTWFPPPVACGYCDARLQVVDNGRYVSVSETQTVTQEPPPGVELRITRTYTSKTNRYRSGHAKCQSCGALYRQRLVERGGRYDIPGDDWVTWETVSEEEYVQEF